MGVEIFLGILFFALGITKVVLYFIGKSTPLNIFSDTAIQTIPGFSLELAQAKSIDIVEYGLLIVLVMVIFGLSSYLQRYRKKKDKIYDCFYLTIAFILFLQTNFVVFSSKLILGFFILFHILFWTYVSKNNDNQKIKFNSILFTNGILFALVALQLIQKVNYSLLLPFSVLVFVPFIYHLISWKFLSNPSHLLLSLFIVKAGDTNWILFLLVVTIVLIGLTELRKSKYQKKINKLLYKLYPYVLITIVCFNPLYYWSDLDSVEEGFWLGWLQRVLNGNTIYKDFYAYHPPLLLWLLKYFVLVFGVSVAKVRLFFHLLQIIAIFIFYTLTKRVISSKVGQTIIMVMMISISNGLIKNNSEIRLAVGLLPLIFLSDYIKRKNNWWLILTGFANGLALMVSLEVGVVSMLAVFIYLVISKRIHIFKSGLYYFIGILAIISPIFLVLLHKGALLAMFNQLAYYSGAFTDGYFNLAIHRSNLLPLLSWKSVNSYLGSTEMWWYFCQLTIIGSFFLGASRYLRDKKTDSKNSIFIILSLIGLILFRSALGRSDWWHLLFSVQISLILVGYLIETYSSKPKMTFGLFLIIFGLVLKRDTFNDYFLHNQIEKIQSYGKIPGTYVSYNTKRYGIAVDQSIQTREMDSLIESIKQTPKDIKIFAYPWMPEVYFLANKINATKIDIPYAFFTPEHQIQIIEDLKNNQNTLIIYNPKMKLGGLTPDKLNLINSYILDNYKTINKFKDIEIMAID